MRNIFDQYTQPENRLSHALATTLDQDRSLIVPFLRRLGVKHIPPLSTLHIVEQQVPGARVSGDEDEGRGLPDICIYTDDGWALLLEIKAQAGINTDQLRRHAATARRHGFEHPGVVLIAIDHPVGRLPDYARFIEWRDIYAWFRTAAAGSRWGRMLTQYMEVFETRMISLDYGIRGTITMFDGLRFDDENPYTYPEAKRLIRLLCDELQCRTDLRKVGVDTSGKRRGAITGRNAHGVWDFLPLTAARSAKLFTDYPHFTIGIRRDLAGAAITVPNGVKGGFRTKLRDHGPEQFLDLLLRVQQRLRPVLEHSKRARAVVYAVQRHYPSQRASGVTDARIEADLRTIAPKLGGGVKHQPQWLGAVYAALVNKRSNIQFGVEAQFDYNCLVLRSPKAGDLFAQSWIAMSPLIDFVLKD